MNETNYLAQDALRMAVDLRISTHSGVRPDNETIRMLVLADAEHFYRWLKEKEGQEQR